MGGKGLSVKFMGVLWHPKNKGVVRFQSRFEVSLDVLYSPPTPTGWKYVSPPPPTSLLNMVTISCPSLLWRVFISCKLLQNITFQRKEASINYIYFIRLIFFVCSKEPRDCNPSRPWEPDPSVVHSVSVGDETYSALAQPRKGPKGLNYEPL